MLYKILLRCKGLECGKHCGTVQELELVGKVGGRELGWEDGTGTSLVDGKGPMSVGGRGQEWDDDMVLG